MSSQHHPLSTWQLLIIAVVLLLGSGSLQSAFGQCLPGEPCNSFTRPSRASNPPASPKRFTSKRPNKKQQAIEQAIADGNQARNKNNYEQALDHYKKAQDLNPKEARAFYGRGNLYSDLYCNDSAIEAYLKALELKKDYTDALINLGYAYIGKERYDEAEEQFQAVLKFKPFAANLGLGYVYAHKGKYQEAIDRINSVINGKSVEDKDRATAYFVLGAVYELQKKRQDAIAQYEKAIGILRQALTSLDSNKIAQPEKPISLKHDLALTYFSLGRLQLSSAYFKLPAFGNVNKLATTELEAFRVSIKQAIDNLDRAKENGYNHPNLYLEQGKALAYQSNYQEAVNKINDYLEKVNKLENQLPPLAKNCHSGFHSLNANGHWDLGFIYFLEGRFEADEQKKNGLFNKAIEQFRQVVKLQQDNVAAYMMLGFIYEQQNNYQEVINQNTEAIRYAKENSIKANAYNSIAQAYTALKNYDDAMRNEREAIKLDPNNPSFYESLAIIYMSQGNIEETFKLLKKATDLRAELKVESAANSAPYFYLGTTYGFRFLHTGSEEDFNEAVKWLKKAINISPKNSIYYQILGDVYGMHSNADEAIANYKKAIEHSPKNLDYYFNIADAYSNLKHNYDAAIGVIRQVIEVKPDFAKAYQYVGWLYHRKNDDTEAIKQELKAIEIDRKYLQAYFDLAEIYKVQKNYPKAIEYLQSAIRIAPTNFQPYQDLARIYEEQKKNEDAIHYYDEAIKLLDADAQSKNFLWIKNTFLGRIERLRGRYAEAISHFQNLQMPPAKIPLQIYDIGLTYVASKNKRAALEQYQQLKQLKSPLADELMKKIEEMK